MSTWIAIRPAMAAFTKAGCASMIVLDSNRWFGNLPPRPDVSPHPHELGAIGGPMDGGYSHISNDTIPAGYTYFAQFVSHDLTCASPPRLDLRALYGNGPDASPQLYDGAAPGLLRTGPSLGPNAAFDIPRDAQGRAILGDPRNDYTIILVQLHAAFVRLHNRIFRACRSTSWRDAFAEARAAVRWQYQHLIVRDLLRRLADPSAMDRALEGRRELVELTVLPLEFTLAMGRFGHAMAKPRYRINDELSAPLFRERGGQEPFDDLRGQRLTRTAAIEWEQFFPTGHPMKAQSSSRLSARVCRPLFQFPFPDARNDLDRSIPYRTLIAAQRAGLPSGQAVARTLGFEPLADEELWGEMNFRGAPAPLWYYVLREADVQQHGQRLGQVGGRMYTDVILRALIADPSSYVYLPEPPRAIRNIASNLGEMLVGLSIQDVQ
jgi:hypothetical protein